MIKFPEGLMKAGAKFTYDVDQFDGLVAAVPKAMGSFGQVADMNGVTRDKIYYWLKTGDEDRDKDLRTDLAQLSSRLRNSQAEVVMDLCQTALNEEKKSKFIMWWLSRICREDFGIEGLEIKQLRDMFKIILPLIGKGDALNGDFNSSEKKQE